MGMNAYIGSIVLFGAGFAPKGWAYCDGSLLAIQRNTALFSILGVTYGGNGTTTFALPDLRGRVAEGAGAGPGLSPVDLGEAGGAPTVTLTQSNLPAHNHTVNANQTSDTTSPSGAVYANDGRSAYNIYASTPDTTVMNPAMLGPAGSNQPFGIMQPYTGLSYIICTEGVFPPHG